MTRAERSEPGSLSRQDAEQVGRALVELVRRPEARTADPRELVAQVPALVLVERALHHRLPGVVHRSLLHLGLDGPEFAGLGAAYQMATLAHRRCLVELATVAGVLGDTRRPWMVVKGPVLAERCYGDVGARLYDDLDLVVPPPDFARALSAIEASGGRVTGLNWPLVVARRRAEIPLVLPHGMLGDLHWDLLGTPRMRSRFTLPLAGLFDRGRTVTVGGTEVPTLDPVDGLIYLCLHGSLSGGDQLVWVKDLDQTVESEPVDWDELVRRARRARADLVVAMQLERARVVLGTRVPAEVPVALAGDDRWWRWWRSREQRAGLAGWGQPARPDSRLVSATSATGVASAVELSRVVVSDMAIHYLGRFRRDRRDGDPVPVLYRPVGAVGGRAEYLARVEETPWP